jgi:thiosulfate/3-mercaptopyruvate sulfurtransferase
MCGMSALIGPEDLRHLIDDVVVIDVQYHLGAVGKGRDDYEQAHLPGAHHVDLDAELAGPPGPRGRHPLPTAHSVQEALRRCGVDADTPVVVYDQGTCTAAARAWWRAPARPRSAAAGEARPAAAAPRRRSGTP